jgi:hypothetical protein
MCAAEFNNEFMPSFELLKDGGKYTFFKEAFEGIYTLTL